MANGELVKLGTLYLAGVKQARPTYPWRNDSGQNPLVPQRRATFQTILLATLKSVIPTAAMPISCSGARSL